MRLQTLHVIDRGGVNVRQHPFIADNVVDGLNYGESVEVIEHIKQRSADGWIWRRIASNDERWVAEVNESNGMRLLAPSPTPGVIVEPQPEPEPEPAEVKTETLVVSVAAVNVRKGPGTNHITLRRIFRGNEVQVYADIKVDGVHGWVWRQLVSTQEEWVAEWNQETGQFLLKAKTEPGPGPEPGPIVVTQGRVQVDGTRFKLDGKPFRFIGANTREFAFYDEHVLPHASAIHQQQQLQGMNQVGMRVNRMWAAHREISVDHTMTLLKRALDLIHQAGILTIVCLNDGVGLSQYFVPGDEEFHTEVIGHLHRRYFVQEGYRRNYLPFVKRVVTTFKDHPAIFAWELGNEYAIHPQPANAQDGRAFIGFAQHVSQVIRNIDPNHLITTGLVNIGHVAPAGHDPAAFSRELHSWPHLDFATVHFYQEEAKPEAHLANEEARSLIDRDVLRALNKPIIVEEFGPTINNPNRVEFLRRKLQEWVGGGAAGFMQWGISFTEHDVGVGGNRHGMDNFAPNNRPIYQGMFDAYREWATRLEREA